jgi:glyceraldehyde 3-phosphate dehydrogenase
MMAVRLAINGFGRTGRSFLRAALASTHEFDIVAVNDLGAPKALARLFARDSVHGRYPEPVGVEGDVMVVGARRIAMLAEPEPKALPWRELGVDVVIESTGRNTSRAKAAAHLESGAGRVVISAPSADADATLVVGVNEEQFDPAHDLVISNASCTTNCLAVLAKVLDDAFGIEDGFMTTVHAYTGDQRLVDALHKDPRRSRGAAINIVPTTTGAARATGLVLPSVAGTLDGLALRVPVPDASVTDLVANLRATPSVDDIKAAYRAAADSGRLVGLLEYSDEPLVSSDIVGSPYSCVFDSELTMAHRSLVKVLGWYDNESGYSSRLADLAAIVGAAARR